MPDVVKLREKVLRVCRLNLADDRPAPHSLTELTEWLGIGAGTLSKPYGQPVADLKASLERAMVMALGFGPDDSEFERDPAQVWPRWTAKWGDSWRKGDYEVFARRLEESGYFVPRPRDDPKLAGYFPKIRRKSNRELAQGQATAITGTVPAAMADLRGRYLDRLASLQVVCREGADQLRHLYADCTFGTVKVETDDAVYLVSINWCHTELYLTEASFEPHLMDGLVTSTSVPIRRMKVKREYRNRNFPSWTVEDSQSKMPLDGEYFNIDLGVVNGNISGEDESSILVFKGGFTVSAMSGAEVGERGILSSLLKYLLVEFVGEIELRGSYRYYLSSRPIGRGVADD
ncbi:MAG TPA: hypothetical protein VGB59_07395 [Allosphingosinicella sp.]|jgi:hypothetical protein